MFWIVFVFCAWMALSIPAALLLGALIREVEVQHHTHPITKSSSGSQTGGPNAR